MFKGGNFANRPGSSVDGGRFYTVKPSAASLLCLIFMGELSTARKLKQERGNGLAQATLCPPPHSVGCQSPATTSCWHVEVSHAGNTYTMEIRRDRASAAPLESQLLKPVKDERFTRTPLHPHPTAACLCLPQHLTCFFGVMWLKSSFLKIASMRCNLVKCF